MSYRSKIYQDTIVTQPATEPVTLAEVKAHLNLDSGFTDDDTLITSYIKAARREVENLVNRTLITTTKRFSLDYFYDSEIRIPSSPLQSITSIVYQDLSDTQQTWATTEYDVHTDGIEGLVTLAYNKTWPDVLDDKNAITITYVCGYGSNTTDVPEEIRVAIMMTVADLYRLRESDTCAPQFANKHVDRLLDVERFRRLV